MGNNNMKITAGLYGLSLLLVIIGLGGCASSQPKLTLDQILSQYTEIATLNNELKEARDSGANYLAPESYEKARQSLETAMNAAHNNVPDKAIEAANEGLKAVARMKDVAASSRKILKEVLVARERALAAGLNSEQNEKLAELDEELIKASSLIEEGDAERAKQLRPKLLDGYAKLELVTLKQNTVEQARSAIEYAKKQGAKKYAPKTLAQAEDELALAVSVLDADRTQTEKAEVHASNAKWMAERSDSISEIIKDFERRDYTMEDIVLWHQATLSTINEPLGGQLPFNEAEESAVLSLQSSIRDLKAAEASFGEQLELTEKERQAIEAKNRAVKEQFETVQAMFNEQEANVFLQHQDVLISAHGFHFPSGQSEIQTDNFPLMNKIIRAIRLFPDARYDIAGHTDSTGAENVNLTISQARADKVGRFLIEVGEISPDRITTSGYGESRPVASNETEAGRAENRRVEIRIINE